MIDPTQHSRPSTLWSNGKGVPAKEDLHAAEAEVASLYYQSTIASMAPAQANINKNEVVKDTANKEVSKSLLGRAKDWLWGIFGWGQKEPVSEIDGENTQTVDAIEPIKQINDEHNLAGGIPKLSEPQVNQSKHLSQTRELVKLLKEITEDEAEMRKRAGESEDEMNRSSSAERDKLILLNLISSSLKQKDLKQVGSNIAIQDLMHHHNKNQELKKKHHGIIDAVNSDNKLRKIIKWVNGGLTVVTVGGSALSFAFGGPIGFVGIGLPLALIGKGVSSLLEGILKYKNDGRTGELVTVREQSKSHTEHKRDRLNETQLNDQDIAELYKRVRHQIDNQNKAERASTGR